MKALVGDFNQEKAIVGAFSVIVKGLLRALATTHLSPGQELVRGVSVPLAKDDAVQYSTVQYSTVQ